MHKKVRRCLVLLAVSTSLCPWLAMAQNQPAGPAEVPPARQIPGITAPDQFPNACVDCHINYTEMNLDARLSTAMMRWTTQVEPSLMEMARAVAPPGMKLTGVHPNVAALMSEIPAGCLTCHKSGSEGLLPLAPLLHKIHLSGGEDAVFLSVYQGECTHCHKLDKTSGQWAIPSAPEH